MRRYSVTEVRARLHPLFVERLYAEYPPRTADGILAAYGVVRPVTMRVNRLKTNFEDLSGMLKREGFRPIRVSWLPDALMIPEATENALLKTAVVRDGYGYLQSLSSMLPPIFLDPPVSAEILDLTAAPGGKTTHIAAIACDAARIIAVERDHIRFERLSHTIRLLGAHTVTPMELDGTVLPDSFKKRFDAVLLDAPCSGEGVFSMSEPRTLSAWKPDFPEKCARTQKKLMKSAADCLKRGGVLVYSTCTINKTENEEVIRHGIEHLGLQPARLSSFARKIPGAVSSVFTGEAYNNSHYFRLLPSDTVEGFFVARLVKHD